MTLKITKAMLKKVAEGANRDQRKLMRSYEKLKKNKQRLCPACRQRQLYYRNGIITSKLCVVCRKQKELEKKAKHLTTKWWLNPKIKSSIGLKTEKRPSRKTLIKKADSAISQYIIARDGHCVLSFLGNCSGRLTNGHLNSRAFYSTRWDEENCACQCLGHNYLHESDPYPFNGWYIKKYGLDKWEKLHARSKSVGEFQGVQGDIKIAELAVYYKEKLKLLP